jgi:hypothetical protein
MTIAMSLLVHGEAVRFNRGRSQGDDYDFKYLKGRDGREYPYVSSQCYKRYWRESLPGPSSPITRAKTAGGKEANQAYTDGNPLKYVDDDLFGYMIAGAAESEEEFDEDLESLEANSRHLFGGENIKDAEALRKKLLQTDSSIAQFILAKSPDVRAILAAESSPGETIRESIVQALNNAVRAADLPTESSLDEGKIKAKTRKALQRANSEEEEREAIRDFIREAFKTELQDKPKRATTRRTAPIRMHALVAFSGIKTAKDFQTFSRDVPYTGRNSVLNPTPQGIYSGWLKTRILIESNRIGRFHIGENMELLEDQVKGREIKSERNPYSRDSEMLRFIELDELERTARLRAAIRALADIGNRQGPASGALHDGSLRPKAFVAGMMKCADSPFDDIWKGGTDDGMPFLDIAALVDSAKDWGDLFASRTLYFGLPHDERKKLDDTIRTELSAHEFEVVIDSPRKALLQLSEEAAL